LKNKQLKPTFAPQSKMRGVDFFVEKS